MGLESNWQKHSKDESSLGDYEDNDELFALLKELPTELRVRHISHIAEMDDSEAAGYLRNLHERREAANKVAVVSDPRIRSYFEEHADEVWKDLETNVLSDEHAHLGTGQTAQVMGFTVVDEEHDQVYPFAIKYLITPTENTMSTQAEHDLILEVERMRLVERVEEAVADKLQHIAVFRILIFTIVRESCSATLWSALMGSRSKRVYLEPTTTSSKKRFVRHLRE